MNQRQCSREWIERTLRHEPSGPVPYNFSFSPPAQRLAESHYGTPLEDRLDLPLRMVGPKSVKPLYADPGEYGETLADEFGVVWSTSERDRGSPVGPCLPESTLSGYTFPDPSAAYRFAHLDEWCALREGHYRLLWVGDLWERATFMRGMEALMTDVVLAPGFADALLRGLADYLLQTMALLFDRFAFEGIAVSDDYGTQQALVLSPTHWRKLIKPRLAEIYALAKQNGRTVFHHSCGNVTEIVGDLVDLGLDLLHPLQPEAMDLAWLKREFGKHLTFCGGVPTQTLLVHGCPEDVRREVRRLKTDMGGDGGYILEPGITLQADVPLENLIALIDEAREP
ncbi:MAG: hypothetical protein COY42_03105 [Armatimonadetes bacterium CG_4_10_14_0_8_um_filter_66_14]|nr:hypothetical protein [Armatimonadota bacterium]PIW20013.1 MAG: hypothetical protein COW34_02820 [Armatimonadetes bacterium CG17_big_fil_post_rev_8_21_14_2_50_66_6]PIX44325.1 MAG: hypothetical protein COZ57_17725 [Armatimonadetes bacterium CG_4_8_14_3_um_filter_66_20]PIZ49768.1 MAG: hypothetical protein COY42_03105 [Armatimonadetes bacterium CG_4_10_14_0_8_um_filter_66_14]NCQ26186.1 hypothetical protein [Armatimonadota bacterium]